MALLRGYIEKTVSANAVKDFLGKIEPKYQPEATLRTFYIHSTQPVIVYLKWKGVDWDEIKTTSVPDANHPYEAGFKFTKTDAITLYVTNPQASSTTVTFYYELDEVPKLEAGV